MQSVPMPICSLFGSAKVSLCPYMGGFWALQSVSVPIYAGLFGTAKCLRAHTKGAFWHCKVFPRPYGGFLAMQSVPVPLHGGFLVVHGVPMPKCSGLFGSAKFLHPHIWVAFW